MPSFSIREQQLRYPAIESLVDRLNLIVVIHAQGTGKDVHV
jgi:hypothetical protein